MSKKAHGTQVQTARMRGRQNGVVIFEVDGPKDQALAEARRYSAQYAEDGPVQVQSYDGRRWSLAWTTHKDIDPTDVSKMVATVDDVLKAGAPARPGEWFIARIMPGGEFKAVHGLAEIGVTSYCPCETRNRGKANNQRKVKIPLLMGYLFVFAIEDDFYGIRSIDGVHSILMGTMGQPKPVATKDVERFRGKEIKGKYDFTINAKEAQKETEALKANFADLQAQGDDGAQTIKAALWPNEFPKAA